MHCCHHSLNCGIQIENTEKIHLSFTKKLYSFKQEILFSGIMGNMLKDISVAKFSRWYSQSKVKPMPSRNGNDQKLTKFHNVQGLLNILEGGMVTFFRAHLLGILFACINWVQ